MLHLAAVSGCVTYESRRPDCTGRDCSFESYENYKLAHVEFRDSGLYLDLDQVTRLEQELDNELAAGKGVVVVVFVHGLEGSSRPNAVNLQKFKQVLVDVGLEANGAKSKQSIFGIHVGWRGQSWIVDRLSAATFGARRASAKAIGQGQFHELLYRLSSIRLRHNRENFKKNGSITEAGNLIPQNLKFRYFPTTYSLNNFCEFSQNSRCISTC